MENKLVKVPLPLCNTAKTVIHYVVLQKFVWLNFCILCFSSVRDKGSLSTFPIFLLASEAPSSPQTYSLARPLCNWPVPSSRMLSIPLWPLAVVTCPWGSALCTSFTALEGIIWTSGRFQRMPFQNDKENKAELAIDFQNGKHVREIFCFLVHLLCK